MEEKNEFEEKYNKDEFDDADDMVSDDSTEQDKNISQEELISSGDSGLEYDINKAPKRTKGPDKIDLDDKEVVIPEMKVILPKPESEWETTKNKKFKYKSCQFILFYDNDGQREYYSGMKVFQRNDGKYSDPVIQNNADTQASKLKKVYADYKGKKSEEVSMYEFLSFLKSKPKALIKKEIVEYEKKKYNKNFVCKFLG